MRIKIVQTTEGSLEDLVNQELAKLSNRVLDVNIECDNRGLFAVIKYQEDPMTRRNLYG